MKITLIDREGTGINRQFTVDLPVVPPVGAVTDYDGLLYRVVDVFVGSKTRLLVTRDGSSREDQEWTGV